MAGILIKISFFKPDDDDDLDSDRLRENAVTMNKMTDLKRQMESLSMAKRVRISLQLKVLLRLLLLL